MGLCDITVTAAVPRCALQPASAVVQCLCPGPCVCVFVCVGGGGEGRKEAGGVAGNFSNKGADSLCRSNLTVNASHQQSSFTAVVVWGTASS